MLVAGPGIGDVIARAEAIVQERQRPRVLQPQCDIAKLLRNETVLPAPAGPAFRCAP